MRTRLFSCLVIFAACSRSSAPASEPAPEPAAIAERAQEAAANRPAEAVENAEREIAAEAHAAATAAPAEGDAPDPSALFGAIANAASEASMVGGDTPCDQAFNGMTAMIRSISKTLPPSAMQPRLPPRDAFISTCRELPAEAQQCLVVSYGMEHQEECREVLNSPEVQRVKEMFQRQGR